MPERFAIEAVGLVFGECEDLPGFLMRWWRGIPFEKSASSVVFVGDLPRRRGTRAEMLATAAASQIAAGAPVVSWDEFRRRRFRDHERLLVVGSVSEAGDQALDLGVALLVSRDGRGVSVERSDHEGWIAPVPRVPESVETLVALAVSAACILYGARPARLQPVPWSGRRVARVGQWNLVSEAPPTPLGFAQPLLLEFRGRDRDELASHIEYGRSGGDGPARLVVVCDDATRELRLAEALDILRTGRSFAEGIYFGEAPLDGEIAFVFPGLTGAYSGVGHAWEIAIPGWRADRPAPMDDIATLVRETMWWQSKAVFLLRDVLNLQAKQVLGVSIGEFFGTWAITQNDEAMEHLVTSNLFQREIAGDFAALRESWANTGHVDAATDESNLWESWTVLGPLDTVLEAVDGAELVYVTEIRTEHECVIGGYPSAVEDVIAELLNSPKIHAEEVEGQVALHAPPVAAARDIARDVFSGTSAMSGVGFLQHFDSTLDSRALWPRAWDEGVRVFIETGPRGNVSNCIDRALGDEHDHLALSIDPRTKWGPRELYNVIARLLSVGVDVDHAALDRLLTLDSRPRTLLALESQEEEKDDENGRAAARRALELQKELGEVHRAQLDAHTRAFESYLEKHLEGMKLAVNALAELRK